MTGFRINGPNVVYESFDEEIVVVNLDTGNYYSLSGTGPTIWVDLVDGSHIDEVVGRIQHRYSGEFDVIAASVAAFAERLVDEKLLVRADDVVAGAQTRSAEPTGSRTPFAAPVIENY